MIKRLKLLLVAAVAIALNGAIFAAQIYPARVVRIICIYPAGGGLDIVIRAVAQKLSAAWGHPVIIENQPGAGTTIGTAYVAKANPDGYTLLATDVSFSISPSLYSRLSYSPASDLAPISLFAEVSQIMAVNPSLPVHSVAELIGYAKAHPGQVLYATAGAGTPPHLTMARFTKRAGVNLVGVPYKGAAESLRDVVAGREQVYSGALGTAVPFVKTGQLRALAVLDSRRSHLLPNVPTISEAGLSGLEVNAWYGLFAPKGTPAEILNVIDKGVTDALQSDQVMRTLDTLGDEPVKGVGPQQFSEFLKSDFVKWKDAVQAAGAKVN